MQALAQLLLFSEETSTYIDIPSNNTMPKEVTMSKKNVEELLIAGGENEEIRKKYDVIKTMEEFAQIAEADGYSFSVTDLEEVLRESGDSFESFGNPAKKMIWWH